MRFYDLQKYLAETFKKNPDFFLKILTRDLAATT